MGLVRLVAGTSAAMLLFAGPAGPVAGAPVKVRHTTFEAAEATWFVKRRGDVYIYYVIAYRLEKAPGRSVSRLFVDRSKCRLSRAKRKRLASCALGGRVHKLDPRNVRTEPLLTGARLDYLDHHVVWDRPQSLEPDVDPFLDPRAAFADAYFQRLSNARGRLFGTRMPKKGLDHAALSYGIDAAVITSPDELPPRLDFEVQAILKKRF